MSGFPPSIIWACICWVGAAILLIHAVLVGFPGVSKKIKIPLVAVGLAAVVWMMWKPVREEYRKEHPISTSVPPAERNESIKTPAQQIGSENKVADKVAHPSHPHPKGKVAVKIGNSSEVTIGKITNETALPTLSVSESKKIGIGEVISKNKASENVQICPGGICAGGDITGSPSVTNNFGSITKLARRIPEAARSEVIAFLSQRPGKIQVSAFVSDAEAYRFAMDWYEALKAAGWQMMGDQPQSFMTSGQPWSGVQVTFNGEPLPPGGRSISNDTPLGHIIVVASALHIEGLTGKGEPNQEEGLVILLIGPHP